ncbi:N-acyl amino acid synthase FeeM domain-containing protein [Sulfuriferula multivorans]|nr:hypothetical protein [Sulfuriferula multivorans]
MMTIQRRKPADEWSKTIVEFQSPHKLREMCIPQSGDQVSAKNITVDQQKFKIRLATSDDRVQSASLLIHKMYSWRGYDAATINRDPNRVTLLAFDQDAIVGTLTLGLDSSVGLQVDDLYKAEIDALRADGRKVCELTKLAVDESVKSKQVLAALFHIAYIYGRNIHNGTDFVIEVNPRHVLFYKRMLGFNHFGPERHCERVSAPAVLLRLELEYSEREIARLGGLGKNAVNEKSLYPYFFSKQDELGITARLQRGENNPGA